MTKHLTDRRRGEPRVPTPVLVITLLLMLALDLLPFLAH